MQDVLADVNEACARKSKGLAPRGLIPTKFAKLDVRLAGSGFMRGNMYVFGARPGMGKTALATSLVTQICECVDIAHDPQLLHVEHKAFFWSGEMPRKQLVLRLWCADSGVPFTRAVNGTLTQQEWNDFTTFGAEFSKLPIDIEDKPGITVAELEARVRESRAAWERPADPSNGHRERRLSVVVVDYLTLMRGTGKEKGREETVAGISRDLKEMAKRLDVALIALVQLNRMVESRTVKDKRPQLSDIRESGQIEQDADLVAFIHRPEYYHPTNEDLRGIAELIFAKQRNGTPTCTVFFHFNGPRMRFGTPDPTMFARISEIYAQGNP
jgi:replicative DNA helicase